ncbi:MAG TPA: hypothetical protein VFY90_11600 [Tepidiformaceae bacterium]|nr:hypothetical protein [Tepidiformaceae bacterium]
MSLHRATRFFSGGLVAIGVVFSAIAFATERTGAQSQPGPGITPVAPGEPPCIGMPPLGGLTEDPLLAITNVEATVETVPGEWQASVDRVTVTWTSPPEGSGIRCIALYTKSPGGDYPALTEPYYPFLGSRVVLQPGSAGAGEYCFKLVALADGRRGPAAEICVEIEHPQGPRPPDWQPTLPPGTLPEITDLRATLIADILNPDGSFKPPEERNNRVQLTWRSDPGFRGTFQVFRSTVAGPQPDGFALVGTVDASQARPDGAYAFEEPIAYSFPETCYRIRAVSGGKVGADVQVCTQAPPSSGPGADSSPTPAPPPTGTGTAAGVSGSTSWAFATFGAAAILLLLTLGRRRPCSRE